jgi:hypothetical protein
MLIYCAHARWSMIIVMMSFYKWMHHLIHGFEHDEWVNHARVSHWHDAVHTPSRLYVGPWQVGYVCFDVLSLVSCYVANTCLAHDLMVTSVCILVQGMCAHEFTPLGERRSLLGKMFTHRHIMYWHEKAHIMMHNAFMRPTMSYLSVWLTVGPRPPTCLKKLVDWSSFLGVWTMWWA